jgi:hypothetical protein
MERSIRDSHTRARGELYGVPAIIRTDGPDSHGNAICRSTAITRGSLRRGSSQAATLS